MLQEAIGLPKPLWDYSLLHAYLFPTALQQMATHTLSESLHGSGIWVQVERNLCFRASHKAAVKAEVKSGIASEISLLSHVVVGRVEFLESEEI